MSEMKCEIAKELLIDDMTGNIGPADQRALTQHLAHCDACRAERTRLASSWEELGQIVSLHETRTGLTRLTTPRSESQVIMTKATPRQPLFVVLALILGLVAGFQIDNLERSPVSTLTALESDYVLLLRTTDQESDLNASNDLHEAYDLWVDELESYNTIVASQRFSTKPDVWLSGADGSEDDPDFQRFSRLDSYVFIQASDQAEAIEIARSSPYLKFGGAVELRSVHALPEIKLDLSR